MARETELRCDKPQLCFNRGWGANTFSHRAMWVWIHAAAFGPETSYQTTSNRTTQHRVNPSSASECYAKSRRLTSACSELVLCHTGNLQSEQITGNLLVFFEKVQFTHNR